MTDTKKQREHKAIQLRDGTGYGVIVSEANASWTISGFASMGEALDWIAGQRRKMKSNAASPLEALTPRS